jgi:hypothetical protein
MDCLVEDIFSVDKIILANDIDSRLHNNVMSLGLLNKRVNLVYYITDVSEKDDQAT